MTEHWHELHERHRREFLRDCRAFLDEHTIGHRLTIDDVREAVTMPEDIDPRVMGSVFKGQPWKIVGYEKSRRSTCHRRPVAVFERLGV